VNPHHVPVPSSVTDDRTRVLKHGDTFAVFDHLGPIKPGGMGEEGSYHDGTRETSNAGQCLFGGIASPERAARNLFVGRVVLGLGYHNGAVWPHDNALTAYGAAGYGLKDLAVAVLAGLFTAGTYLDLNRLPELFCGFDPRVGQGAGPRPCGVRSASLDVGPGVPVTPGVPGVGVN